MERDYNKDLEMDLNALELEWEKQSAICLYWGKKEADALEAKDKAVQKLGLVQAEMDAKIRSNPNKYGLGDKPTEPAIKNIIASSKEYIAAENDLIQKNKTARVMAKVGVAIEHKKRGLTKNTDLWLGGYWSVSGKKAPKEMQDNIRQRKGEEIRQGLNRR